MICSELWLGPQKNIALRDIAHQTPHTLTDLPPTFVTSTTYTDHLPTSVTSTRTQPTPGSDVIHKPAKSPSQRGPATACTGDTHAYVTGTGDTYVNVTGTGDTYSYVTSTAKTCPSDAPTPRRSTTVVLASRTLNAGTAVATAAMTPAPRA